MKYLVAVLLFVVAGCAGKPRIEYVTKPVEVLVPVFKPCQIQVPKPRPYATDNLVRSSTDFTKIKTILVGLKEHEAIESMLRDLLDICTKGST